MALIPFRDSQGNGLLNFFRKESSRRGSVELQVSLEYSTRLCHSPDQLGVMPSFRCTASSNSFVAPEVPLGSIACRLGKVFSLVLTKTTVRDGRS